MINTSDIVQGNRLIAEWLGYKIIVNDWSIEKGKPYYRIEKRDPRNHVIGSDHPQQDIELQINRMWGEETTKSYGFAGRYHYSWDALMPVVESIEAHGIYPYRQYLDFEEDYDIDGHFWFYRLSTEVDIYANVYYWQKDRPIKGLTSTFSGDTPIEATWRAVVAFILWQKNISSKQ